VRLSEGGRLIARCEAANVAAMPFELQPTLRSAVVTLRPVRAEDFDALYAVAADPAMWEQHPDADRHRPDVFRRFFDEQLGSGGALVVIENHGGQIIGMSRFHGYDAERGEVEIGWTFLSRSYWGGTYNGEVKRLMLEHAFRFVSTVVFLVGVHNYRSQRSVEKLGAVRVGSRRDGGGRQSIVYAIDRDGFARM
jgi:RimJ/RimL family protein N-acetyltransferase